MVSSLRRHDSSPLARFRPRWPLHGPRRSTTRRFVESWSRRRPVAARPRSSA